MDRVVKRSIRLNDQAKPQAREINDVGTERNLSTELHAIEAAISE